MKSQSTSKRLLTQFVRLVRAGLQRVLGLHWLLAVLYERNLINEPLPEVKPKVPIEIVRGQLCHIEVVRQSLPSEWISLFEERLAEGKIWLLAFVEQQFAYSTWIGFDDVFDPNTGIWVRLAPGEAYLFNSFTVPEFRGLALHTTMTARRMAVARERGAECALVVVHADNAPARHVMTKLGCRERERILTVRFLRWWFVRRFPRKEK